jgi:AraC family transcriptional regulator of adaptative response/methylated-DNA-[protein]-cysteine methyltransferase
MIAISNETGLYLLEFVDHQGLERKIERLCLKIKSAIIPGTTEPITSIEKELEAYFSRQLKEFKTPLHLIGSPFQKFVWEALMKIPYGQTISYAAEALMLKKPASACRAVANANGANQLAIITACHRVINANSRLGGYGAGIMRQK